MAEKSCSVSSLPWLWVMETLASFERVDISLLKDLMIKAPEVSDNLGRNVKEMIALRCLEALFSGITNDVHPVVHSKMGFDPSESCEDVLQCILRKVSASKLRMGEPELLKWNVHPFIAHKRACLPKCALQELKDTILEGSHPSAASLKERSGLRFESQCETRTPNGDGDSGAVAPRVDESTACGQVEAAKGDLIPLTAENENNLLPEDTTERILLPYKRGLDDLPAKNLMGQFNPNVDSVNYGGDSHSNAKRRKHDAFCSITSIEPNSVSLHGKKLLEDSSRPSINECELAKESQLGDLEGSTMVSEDDHDKYVVSKRVEQITDVDHEEFEHNQTQIPFHSNKMPQNMPRDESHHDISVDEAKDDDVEHWVEPNKSIGAASVGSQQKTAVDEAKDDGDCRVEPNKSSGSSDESQKKSSVDEAKDDGDHSSQPKASNDKLPNEAHHKVFVDEAKDDTEHCCEEEMLSDSTEYHDEEDGIAMERQNFLSSKCTFNHDSLSIAGWTEQNLCMKCTKDGQLLVCSSSGCPLVVHENCLGCPPSFDNMGNFYCPFCAYSRAVSEYLESKKKVSLAKKELASFINAGMKHEPVKPKKKHRKKKNEKLNESANLVKVCENGHVKEKRQTRANHGNAQVTDQLIRRNVEKHDGVEEQGVANLGVQQEALQQQISDPLEDPASGTSGDENDRPSSSTYYIRFRRQQQQYTFPPIHQLRRKKLAWTAKEEEILKVGVQKFSNDHDKSIPWKKIMEFGGTVFQRGRTTIDLKDKWRNICKGSPKSK